MRALRAHLSCGECFWLCVSSDRLQNSVRVLQLSDRLCKCSRDMPYIELCRTESVYSYKLRTVLIKLLLHVYRLLYYVVGNTVLARPCTTTK